jgi:hypothetical protein
MPSIEIVPLIGNVEFKRGDTAPKKVVDFEGEKYDIYAILTKPAPEGSANNVAQSKFTVYTPQQKLQDLNLNSANDTVEKWKQATLTQKGIKLEEQQKPRFAED